MHARAGDFFFFLDPRIHGSSKIRTDPRRIRIDPGFGGFVLPLIFSQNEHVFLHNFPVLVAVPRAHYAKKEPILTMRREHLISSQFFFLNVAHFKRG